MSVKSLPLRQSIAIWMFSILAGILALSLTYGVTQPVSAAACRFAPFTVTQETMAEAADWSEAIVIGNVTSSTSRRGDVAFGTAVLQPEAFLKGGLAPGPFELSGLTTDCMGNGPPLYEGESVLLVIGRAGPSNEYYVHPLLKTVFVDNQAFTDPAEGEPYAFGDAETAIRRWAAAADASDDATERAVLAVIGGQDESGSFADPALILGCALAGIAAVAGVLLYRRRKTT